MSTPVESAQLILRLYELRREPVLREARAWFAGDCNPTTYDELAAVIAGPKGVWFRMVTGYWEMAASLVAMGAIDPAMFAASGGELIFTFAKFEQFLDRLRTERKDPKFLQYMETVVRRTPGSAERMERIRARYRPATK